jgi:hypothetical protein
MFSPLETKDGKDSVVDDFMYGSNVASAHVYIRMGKLWIIHIQSRQDGLCHFRASIMGTDCNSRKVQMDTKNNVNKYKYKIHDKIYPIQNSARSDN